MITLGQLVITAAADEVCVKKGIEPLDMARRHQSGDWGAIDPADIPLNQAAVEDQGRIMSAYEYDGEQFWVITDEGWAATTIMLPSDY